MEMRRYNETRSARGIRCNKGKPREYSTQGRLAFATVGGNLAIHARDHVEKRNEINAYISVHFDATETARIRRALTGEARQDLEAFASDYAHGLGPDIARLRAIIATLEGDNA